MTNDPTGRYPELRISQNLPPIPLTPVAPVAPSDFAPYLRAIQGVYAGFARLRSDERREASRAAALEEQGCVPSSCATATRRLSHGLCRACLLSRLNRELSAAAFPDIPDIFFRPDFDLTTARDFEIIYGTDARLDSLVLQERLVHYLDEERPSYARV